MQPFLTAEFHLVTCTCLRCNSDIQSQSWLQLVIQACSTSIQQSAFQQEHPVKHKEHHSNRVLHTTFASVESQPSHFTDSSYVLTVPPPFTFENQTAYTFFQMHEHRSHIPAQLPTRRCRWLHLLSTQWTWNCPAMGILGLYLPRQPSFPLTLIHVLDDW